MQVAELGVEHLRAFVDLQGQAQGTAQGRHVGVGFEVGGVQEDEVGHAECALWVPGSETGGDG